ncbi:hypothetical protein FEM03_17540 [Phragmitibacter flavus]|uniref:Uncharacterized protein n=1 Tax=Phragmitibacter flavus TaxID=2576071 RepID=A0A5R8KAX1_9BACT|nr:hypothetical protein [Phragmitibacter flavus]TLD69446.1 hypothetical protein FEM03_17540 [Phragmitibacter flavus]
MPDPASILIKAVYYVGHAVVSFFELIKTGQDRLSENSRVGESPMDQESRACVQNIIDHWHWMSLTLIVIAALLAWFW